MDIHGLKKAKVVTAALYIQTAALYIQSSALYVKTGADFHMHQDSQHLQIFDHPLRTPLNQRKPLFCFL